jgi:hypothetical protein
MDIVIIVEGQGVCLVTPYLLITLIELYVYDIS